MHARSRSAASTPDPISIDDLGFGGDVNLKTVADHLHMTVVTKTQDSA